MVDIDGVLVGGVHQRKRGRERMLFSMDSQISIHLGPQPYLCFSLFTSSQVFTRVFSLMSGCFL